MDIIAVDNLSGRQFEGFLAKLLADIGFSNVKRTALSGDFGGDILAEKDGKTCVIQAKRVGEQSESVLCRRRMRRKSIIA